MAIIDCSPDYIEQSLSFNIPKGSEFSGLKYQQETHMEKGQGACYTS